MTEKAEFSTVYSEFTCCEHTFTTAQSLKRHKKSPSHKRLADPEFAKTEAAEKAAKDAEKAVLHCDFMGCSYETKDPSNLKRHKSNHTKAENSTELLHCDFMGCSYETKDPSNLKRHKSNHTKAENLAVESGEFICCGHDYRTAKRLSIHRLTDKHKGLTDPEFAKTEAAKKAEVKCKRKREKDSEAVQQANARKRLRLSKLKDREEEFLRNAKVSNDREADFIVGDGTEEDAKKALERYHGSSSAAMLLDLDDNERTLEKIQKFIHVSKERKAEIRKLWKEGEMSDNKPLLVCASCGMRDHGEYAEEEVAKLPFFFEFKENDHARLDILKGGVKLMNESGLLNEHTTDLSPIMSSYLCEENEKRYHLHPEAIRLNTAKIEVCDFCVGCLSLVSEERDAGAINLEALDAKLQQTKRDISRKKVRESSMSIASGCDYGVQSRITELESPSILERCILCPQRAYYVTVKVKNPIGLPGAKSLQGDIICFTQDGPAEAIRLLGKSAKETLKERIDWVRGGGNFRVFCVDDQGNMENWLHDNSVLVARPHVIFNELRVRALLDKATGNESGDVGPEDFTYAEDFVAPLNGFEKIMFESARHMRDKEYVALETLSQLETSDVAGVRDFDNGGEIGSVGIMSSSIDVPIGDSTINVDTFLDLMQGDASNEHYDPDIEKVSATSVPEASSISTKLPRSSDAVNEFENNGLSIMKLFRHIFPLMHSKKSLDGDGKSSIVYGPLIAKGTLNVRQRKHIMMQFTTIAARDPIFHHFVANQTRRHIASATVSRLPKSASIHFEKIVTAPDFEERCGNARQHPKSPDAKILTRQISKCVKMVGKVKPWSGQERENIKALLLAMKDRYGAGNMFYTIAYDDLHDMYTIRLCFPTKKLEGFPSFAGKVEDVEADHIEKMKDALRNDGTLHVDGSGDVRFDSGQLQRLVTTNPTACSLSFHRMVEKVQEILFGRNWKTKRTEQIFDEVDGRLCLSKAAQDKNIAPGIFGLTLGDVSVTECSSRKALHIHGITYSAASSEFLAAIAANDEVWENCAEALQTQIGGEVGLEVWVMNKLQKTLRVKNPRATFNRDYMAQNSPEAQTVREGMVAVSLNAHSHEGKPFTCHKGFSGKWGCRLCYRRGHPVKQLEFVQLKEASKVTEDDELVGDNGDPIFCDCVKNSVSADEGEDKDTASPSVSVDVCTAQWVGYNEQGDEEDLLQVKLTKPLPYPIFSSNEKLSESVLPIDNRNLVLETRRRRITPIFDDFNSTIDSILASVDKIAANDGESLVRAVQSIYEHPLFSEVLAMPDLAALKKELAEITPEKAQQLIEELKSLPCAESMVVDWSPELTHASCSNTAPYHLGAGRTALATMYYLAKYFKKEAGAPNCALSVLCDARDHIDEYGSKGPNSDTPAHFARHLLTRCVNKGDQELSGTQSASVTLGFPSFHCSDIAGYVDNHCVLQRAQEACTEVSDVLFDEQDFGQKNDVDSNDEDDVGCKEFPDTRAFDSDDEDDGTVDNIERPSAKVYSIPTTDGRLKVVTATQSMNYEFRNLLGCFNYVEYCNMVSIEKHKRKACDDCNDNDDSTSPDTVKAVPRGRKSSKIFNLHPLHPLSKDYVQIIREKFQVPIRAGGSRPTFPPPLKEGASPSSAWTKQNDHAAAFYSANLKPWSINEPPVLSSVKFRQYITSLNDISKDHNNVFADRLIATGRLQEFRNYAFLGQLDKEDLRINRQYRQRNRKMWNEEERNDFWKDCGGNESKKDAENSVEALRKRQEARKTDVRRIEAAERDEDWVDSLTNQVRSLFKIGSTGTRFTSGVIDVDFLRAYKANLQRNSLPATASQALEAASNLYATEKDNKGDDLDIIAMSKAPKRFPHEFDLETADENSTEPYIVDDIDGIKYPQELSRISENDYLIARADWEAKYKLDFKNKVDGSPRPPCNLEQRDLGRHVLRQVRLRVTLRLQSQHINEEEVLLPRAVSTEKNDNDLKEVGIMVIGAPGVGKSHSISTISFFINHENLGSVLSTSYTGVATLQLPPPRATQCWIFSIPGCRTTKALSKMSEDKRLRFESIAGNVVETSLLVLDEASFNDVTSIEHMSARMIELTGCTLPFGGVFVVMLADFHQKEGVMCTQMHKATLIADLPPEIADMLKVNGRGKDKITITEFGADRKGINLFKKFRRFNLTRQMRASDDPQHTKGISDIRNIFSEQPISEDILQSLQPLTQEAIDANPKLQFARIVAMSWKEIWPLSLMQIYKWARLHNVPVIRWKKILTGASAGYLDEDETEELFKQENSGLYEYFVQDMPCTFLVNINVQNGIVNGAKGTADSLTLDEGEPPLKEIIENSLNDETNWEDGVLLITLSVRPISFNARILVSKEQAELMKQQKCLLPDPPDYDSSITEGPREVRIAITLNSSGFSSDKYHPFSYWAARESIPSTLFVQSFPVMQDFVVTDFKVQGTTEEFLISCLRPRKHAPHFTVQSFNVQFSRVTLGKNFFALGLDKDDMNHLRNLKHPSALIIWEQSYDENGFWSPALALAAANALVTRRQVEARVQKLNKRSNFTSKGQQKSKPIESSESDQDSDAEDEAAVGVGASKDNAAPNHDVASLNLGLNGQDHRGIIVARGITNLGNTCFAAAVFQLLSSSSSFLSYIQMMSASLRSPVNNDDLSQQTLIELNRVLTSLYQSMNTSVIGIHNLIRLFPTSMSNRLVCHDAHEYLVHIRAQIDNAKISSTLSQQPMPLQGTWRSRRQCLSCSHFKEVVEEQKFEDLTLHLPDENSENSSPLTLASLLSNLVSASALLEAFCEHCSPHLSIPMRETYEFTEAPQVLTIHLARFKADLTKNCIPVLCDEEFVLNLQSGEVISYKHKATLSHRGHHLNDGHYVAYKKMPDGRCFSFNDALVSPVEQGVVFNSSALEGGGVHAETPYLLLYERML